MTTEELVLQGLEGLSRARVALAGAPTEQLPVNAASLVSLRGDDVQAAQIGHASAQLDVRPSTGHVRCDGDAAGLAGFGDDLGFFGVTDGVQDLVVESVVAEHL